MQTDLFNQEIQNAALRHAASKRVDYVPLAEAYAHFVRDVAHGGAYDPKNPPTRVRSASEQKTAFGFAAFHLRLHLTSRSGAAVILSAT